MKKVVAVAVILSMLLIVGCGDKMIIDGRTYDTYGVFTMEDGKNPDIQYRLIIGNVVWSILLFQTIVMPVYFIGWSLYEPVGLKENFIPGVVD